MDIYTTSFNLPRHLLPSDLSPSSSFDYGSRDGPQQPSSTAPSQQPHPHSPIESTTSFAPSSATSGTTPTPNRNSTSSLATDASGSTVGSTGSDLNEAMHRLCVDAMAAHQCLVSFTPVDALGGAQGQGQQGKMFNFHLSGGYQQVMSARGSLLRESPFKVRSSFLCPPFGVPL